MKSLLSETGREWVRVDPEILGGTPCFPGTRVPVDALWDDLEQVGTLDAFPADFPSVSQERVGAVMGDARRRLGNDALAS